MNKIIVKKNLPQTELDAMHIKKWPIWEKEVSIVEGECLVTPRDAQNQLGVTIKFSQGDLVLFPAGLSIQWAVIKPLKKHYKLDGSAMSQAFRRIKLKLTR